MKRIKKLSIKMDERNKFVALRIIAIMYFLTILAIQGIVIYRQIALGQDIKEFEDIAIIMAVNSLFLVSALLYFGAIVIQRFTIKSIVLIFTLLSTVGALFIYAKYNLFQSPGLSPEQLFHKMLIVILIIGFILGFWIVLSILGNKRLEKELE